MKKLLFLSLKNYYIKQILKSHAKFIIILIMLLIMFLIIILYQQFFFLYDLFKSKHIQTLY